MIHRDQIIERLKGSLEPLPFIYAFWLEGADACDTVDEYSDLDFYVDFEDAYEQQAYDAVEAALSEISEIDYKYIIQHDHPKLRQRFYHLQNTDEYLMIDFCWQLHSRPTEEYTYINGNRVESAKVLFDKANVIRFVDDDPEGYKPENEARLQECIFRYTQHCRVRKYILRKQYLEAFAYYNRYVLEPLIDVLRILYTPANAYLYLLHISHHIPEAERIKLEYFAQIPTLEDMAKRIPEAEQWFDELLARVNLN